MAYARTFTFGESLGDKIGVSAEAKVIRDYTQRIREANLESISLGWRSRLINELIELETECSEQGWDGEDALPVTRRSLYAAKAFLDALPDSVCVPEVTPENSGTVSFDWMSTDGRVLSVSISDYDYVFAGNVFGRQFNGKGRFQDELPEEIALELGKYFQA